MVLKHRALKICAYGRLRLASFAKVLSEQWFEIPNLRPLTARFARQVLSRNPLHSARIIPPLAGRRGKKTALLRQVNIW